MAFNPQRSWAVTYNQMWNLSMKDPLPKNNARPAYHHNSRGTVAPQKGNSNPMQVRRNKFDYCWNFNKGVPCKFGARCKFIGRYKYLDSPSHGVNACVKLQKKEGNGGRNSTPQGNTANVAATTANLSK